MKTWIALAVLACLALAARGSASDDDVRFSQTLTVAERTAAGLDKLSSDNLGVLDALVRRDLAVQGSTRASDAALFSQRLSADERRNIGFALLTPPQIAQLDAFVARHETPRLARALLAPPVFLARRPMAAETTDAKKGHEIHGSFSLSYGWGSGGYSAMTGSILMTMENPEKHLSVSIGYSESHIKGPNGPYLVEGAPLLP